jgi:hypothetical protein
MATAPSSSTRSRRRARPAPPPPPWRRWLVFGFLFGLGYGFTQRLVDLRWQEDSTRPPAFRMKTPSGGVSLEELRRRHGDTGRTLPADLERLAGDQREAREKQEAAKREEAARLEDAQRAEKERLESERRRLDAFDSPPEPTAAEPVRRDDPLLLTPPTPELPPPEPFNAQRESTPPDQPSAEATPSQP